MITNLFIEDNEIHLSDFDDISLNQEDRQKLIAIVKDEKFMKKEKCSFDLIDVDISVANALRRTIIGGIKVKALHLEMQNITKTIKFLIYDELLLRIQSIPLLQSCPLDIVFNIDEENISAESFVIYSSHIKSSDGKQYFEQNLPLAVIEPGTMLKVSNIIVKEGYNYQSAMYSASSNFEYRVLDYVGIDYLYEKSIINHMVPKDVFLKIAKKHKLNIPPDEYNKVLYIINPIFVEFHKDSLNRYKYIIENSDNVEDYLPWHSSSYADPREFNIKFITNGNFTSKDLLKKCMDTLIADLLEIKENIQLCITNQTQEEGNIEIDYYEKITKIRVNGHTFTLSNLLCNHILLLDPSIAFVNIDPSHHSQRHFTLNIIHPEPFQITQDAIDMLVKLFESFIVNIK